MFSRSPETPHKGGTDPGALAQSGGSAPRDRTDLVSVFVDRPMILLVPRAEGSALKKFVIFCVVSDLAGG